MENRDVSRRTLLKNAGAVAAGLSVLQVAAPTHALGQARETFVPWLDQPEENPVPHITGNLLRWEQLYSWLTPAHDFFFVNHFGIPEGLDESTWL